MKIAEILPLLLKGAIVTVGEYRGGRPDVITYRNKTTGKEETMKMIRHNVEVGENAVSVVERLPDTADVARYMLPAKKGDLVCVHIAGLTVEKGNVSIRPKPDGIQVVERA